MSDNGEDNRLENIATVLNYNLNLPKKKKTLVPLIYMLKLATEKVIEHEKKTKKIKKKSIGNFVPVRYLGIKYDK